MDIAERIETATLRPKKVDMEIGSGKEGNAMTGRVYYSLYDRLLHEKALLEAFKEGKSLSREQWNRPRKP